jgi:hypothetical protein
MGEHLLCSMEHRASRKNWRCIEQEGGFTPSRDGGLGAGVYVTRNEQKAAWYSGKHGSNGVVIKLKVALGRYVEINEQAHPLQKTWLDGAWVWLCICTRRRHRGARGKLHR